MAYQRAATRRGAAVTTERKPTTSEIIASIERRVTGAEARLVPLESAALHCADPADREADKLLRDLVRWIRLTAKFGGMLWKVAPMAAVLGAVWYWGADWLDIMVQKLTGGRQ